MVVALIVAITSTALMAGFALVFAILLPSGKAALVFAAGILLILLQARISVAALPRAVRRRAGLRTISFPARLPVPNKAATRSRGRSIR